MATSLINRQEYYSALGRITVNMNHLEQWVRTSLFIMLGEQVTRFVWAIFAKESFGRLMDVLRFAFSYKISEKALMERFNEICEKIDNLSAERNRYLHSVWLFAEDDSFVYRTRNLRWPYIEYDTEPDIATLNKLADNLGLIPKELFDFINEVFPRPTATPTNT
jgi:hypothetical protein